ncbi:unnamed protein product [Lathyrus oleraceus]
MEEYSSILKQEEDAKFTKQIQAQEVVIIMEEFEECKTPKCSRNKIPVLQNCPPAPIKKRKVSPFTSQRSRITMKRSAAATELKYVVKDEEVDCFFQSMFHLTKVTSKRCRSI